jgi:hypothetical protein
MFYFLKISSISKNVLWPSEKNVYSDAVGYDSL